MAHYEENLMDEWDEAEAEGQAESYDEMEEMDELDEGDGMDEMDEGDEMDELDAGDEMVSEWSEQAGPAARNPARSPSAHAAGAGQRLRVGM